MDISKLAIKPIVHPRKPVEVIVKQQATPVTIQGVVFKDAREEKATFNIQDLKKKIQKATLTKVSEKMEQKEKEVEEPKAEVPIEPPKKKAKKVQKKLMIIEEGEKEEGEKTEVVAKRQTPKLKKGVAELGPEEWVEIGDLSRLPPKQPKINIKVPSYYMNNRQIFVNFINSLFEPYKKEFENADNEVSCDTIGQGSESFSLLTHQKVVRDYMNLYTPYRGLLLLHAL
jgi:hypothetical protein